MIIFLLGGLLLIGLYWILPRKPLSFLLLIWGISFFIYAFLTATSFTTDHWLGYLSFSFWFTTLITALINWKSLYGKLLFLSDWALIISFFLYAFLEYSHELTAYENGILIHVSQLEFWLQGLRTFQLGAWISALFLCLTGLFLLKNLFLLKPKLVNL